MPKVAGNYEGMVRGLIKKYNKYHTDKLPNITPHSFRHTYCTNMANKGMNPNTLPLPGALSALALGVWPRPSFFSPVSGPVLPASARTSDRSITLPEGAGPPSMLGITACSVCSGAGGGGPPGASGVALVLVSSAMLANTSLSRLGPYTQAAQGSGISSAYKNTAYCPVRRCFV